MGLDLPNQALEDELEAYVGPPGHWASQRDVQIKILNNFDLRESEKVIEIGCGAMRGGTVLTKYLHPGKYTGVDLDPTRLAAGQKLIDLFGLQDKQPNLIVSDCFATDCLPPASMDLVWAFQVIPHMTEAITKAYINAVAYHLKRQAHALFTARIVTEGDLFQYRGKWQEYPTTSVRREFYQRECDQYGLVYTDHGSLSEWGLDPALGGAKNRLIELTFSN